jgi:hypothetical protein
MTKCKAVTGSGEPCKNNAIDGEEYCHVHEPEEEPKGPCGHINRHSYNHKGELDPLECEKEEGHSGNHGTYHYEVIYGEPDHNPVTGIVKPSVQYEGERWVEWNDAAGIPVDKIQEDNRSLPLGDPRHPDHESAFGN